MSRLRSIVPALVLLIAVPARAQIVDGTSTTLLAGHADPRDGKTYTVVPIYEMVSLVATELTMPYVDDLRVEVSGWGLAAFGNPGDNTTNCKFANAALGTNACLSGDLDLANVRGKLLNRRLVFKLGRQLVVGGAARMTQLDGLSAEMKFWRDVGIQAYGGAPVTPRFGISRGDALAGGRLFYRKSVTTEVGLSAIYVLGEGRLAREDVALDARYRIIPGLTATGFGIYSLYELRLAEANLAVTAQPWRIFDITVDYRRISPDLFLPRNSIFSVFSQETRDEAGVWFSVQPMLDLRVYGDYHIVSDETGVGQRGGIKGSYAVGGKMTVGAEGLLVQQPGNKGYYEARLYGWGRVAENVTATLDVEEVWLDQAVNGRDWSFTTAATVGWDFKPGWRAVITAMADSGPFVDGRFEAMARLVYNGTHRFREVGPATSASPKSEVKQ